MGYGWVSIHRQLQEHWLWKDKPFSYGQAWVDMILLANHADNKFPFANDIVTVKTGSFITSELKLMERWGWSKSKVRRFLSLLETDNMIIKKTDRKKTTITIVNYDDFQFLEPQKDQKKTNKKPITDRKKTNSRPIKDTNNNDNNDNNDNNRIYTGAPELDEALIEFIKFRKGIKKPMTDNAVNLLVKKLNKFTVDINEQIEILNQSIVNGWSGIYELKDKKPKYVNTGIQAGNDQTDLDDLF